MTAHAFTKLGGKQCAIQPDTETGSAAPILPVFIQTEAFQAPIYYQAHTPSCGAHAGTWLSVFLWSFRDGMKSFSPRFTWIDIKKNGIDRNPDDGSAMPDIFASLKDTGVDDFEPLENDASLDNATYASPSAVTPAMLTNALTRAGVTGKVAAATNMDSLCALIEQHQAVILLIRVGATMWTAKDGTVSWAEKDVLPLRPPSPVVDGHFIAAHSYVYITDAQYAALQGGLISLGHIIMAYEPTAAQELGINEPTTEVQATLLGAKEPANVPLVIFANSWSLAWGYRGMGYFGPDYMPYVLETGVAALPALPTPAPSPLPPPSPTPAPNVPVTPVQPVPVSSDGWFLVFLDAIAAFIHKLFGNRP